jgi:hypothetical protein
MVWQMAELLCMIQPMRQALFTIFALAVACCPLHAEDAPSLDEASEQPAAGADSVVTAVDAQTAGNADATGNADSANADAAAAAADEEPPPPPSLTKLYQYFGITGISSILFSMASLIFIVAHVRQPLVRTRKFSIALGLAAAGFLFAELNSENVSAIMVDRSREIDEARESQAERERLEEEVESKEPGKKEEDFGAFSDINMGDNDKETEPEEKATKKEVDTKKGPKEGEGDEATTSPKEAEKGVKETGGPKEEEAGDKEAGGKEEGKEGDTEKEEQGEKSIYEKAAEEEAVPLYKRRGKKQRSEGKTEENSEIRAAATAASEQRSVFGTAQEIVLMPEGDKILADKLDMLNLFVAKWLLVLAIGTVVWDYLSRFNETFDTVLPLPIAGPWLDRLYPKKHIVLAKRPTSEELREFLLKVVRKGETFIYLGKEANLNQRLIARLRLNLGKRVNSIFNRIGLWLEDPEANPFPGIRMVNAFLSWDSRLSRILSRVIGRAAFIVIMLPIVLCCIQSLVWLVDASRLEDWRIVLAANAVGAAALIVATLKSRETRFEAFNVQLNEFVYRAFRRTVSRMPFILAALFLLMVPIPIFFETNEDPLLHYILLLCLVPLPFIFIDSPFLEPFLRRQHLNSEETKSTDYILESAWFGRLGFTLEDEAQARLLLADLEGFLTSRRIPRACAMRAVNIIWAFDNAPVADELAKISEHCQKANFRFIILSDDVQQEEGGPFEEVRTGIDFKAAS